MSVARCMLLLVACSGSACAADSEDTYAWDLPPGFPVPAVPATHPMSEAKVELGRHLFYDRRLSGNGTQSCASCHDQALAFADARPLPVGSTGDVVPRNAMSLANVAYLPTLTWGNPVLRSLEEQALVPMFGELPVELGLAGQETALLERLAADPRYLELFADAFPERDDPIAIDTIVAALASFQRTLLSGGAPYDRWLAGDPEALSPAAQRGERLFFSERTECYHCHSGPTFSTAFRSAESQFGDGLQFENNALYNLDGTGGYPLHGHGLAEFTGNPADMGKFRIPPLRNIELTAPYMHDGSIATLEEVIDHYAAGGRTLADGPYAGVGADNPYKSPLVRAFVLEPSERDDLVEFLRSLTDWTFVTDPRFADPWAE